MQKNARELRWKWMLHVANLDFSQSVCISCSLFHLFISFSDRLFINNDRILNWHIFFSLVIVQINPVAWHDMVCIVCTTHEYLCVFHLFILFYADKSKRKAENKKSLQFINFYWYNIDFLATMIQVIDTHAGRRRIGHIMVTQNHCLGQTSSTNEIIVCVRVCDAESI